jgi:hypothetical protein
MAEITIEHRILWMRLFPSSDEGARELSGMATFGARARIEVKQNAHKQKDVKCFKVKLFDV